MGDDSSTTEPTIVARLLFLSANASDRSPLAVDREYNRVKTGLQTLGVWPAWRAAVEHVPAAAWEQVPEQLLLHAASIVHFAGHGYPDGSLEFTTLEGGHRRINADGLARLFESYAGQVRLVVLNACFSSALAEALTEYIDVVVGMTHAISDEAAILFAPTFYQQLAGGKSVQTAFEVGCAVLLGQRPETAGSANRDVERLKPPDRPADDDAQPRVRVRPGVDASRMVFAPGPVAGRVRSDVDRGTASLEGWKPRTRWAGPAGAAGAAVAMLAAGGILLRDRPLAATKVVVRVHEPGAVDDVARVAGRVELNGPDAAIRSRPLVDGEAIFDDLPADAAGRVVEVSVAEATGFQPRTERHVVPKTGVLRVELARVETTSVAVGTVLDARGQPLAGAVVDVDHGLVLAQTDQRGAFRVVVPRPPGALVSVMVAFQGHVGVRENLTVPGPFTLRWAP